MGQSTGCRDWPPPPIFAAARCAYAERVKKLGFAPHEELTLEAVWRRSLRGEPDPGASYSRVAVIESPRMPPSMT